MLDADFAILTDLSRILATPTLQPLTAPARLTENGKVPKSSLINDAGVSGAILSKLREGKAALVIPAFEYENLEEGVNATTFPRRKQDVLLLVEEGRLIMFHNSWGPGHGPSDYPRWYGKGSYSKPAEEAYKVTDYHYRYEPYVIVSKDHVPWCEERFVGYGVNKAACLFEMYIDGVDFYVLPKDFIIHQTHAYPESARRKEVGTCGKDESAGELILKFHVTPSVALVQQPALPVLHQGNLLPVCQGVL